jgi:hypothetical protein
MHQPETAAAEAGGLRLDHAERRGDRYRGVEGVSALIENFESSVGRDG